MKLWKQLDVPENMKLTKDLKDNYYLYHNHKALDFLKKKILYYKNPLSLIVHNLHKSRHNLVI